jgi:hypothetical protein
MEPNKARNSDRSMTTDHMKTKMFVTVVLLAAE